MTMRSVLDICVCNPVTDQFTTFEIILKTSDPAFTLSCSRTRRRYNDFVWLKKVLKSHHPLCTPPELPEKKKSSERFEPQFLVRRMTELEDWLYKVVDESLYFSDSTFHLFLQTNLSCKQIEAYTKGSLPEAIVQQAYKECDFKEEQSTFVSFVKDDHPSTSEPKPPEPSHPIPVTPRPRLSLDSQERSDSGLSVTEPDSDLESSSYESQNSVENSGESGLTVYPPITEVVCDKSNVQRSSLASGHVTCTGSDVTLKAEEKLQELSLSGSGSDASCDTRQEAKDQKSRAGSHRVEMGVIFPCTS